MDALAPFVRQILRRYLTDATPKAVRGKMTKAIPKITAGMVSKGMTLDEASPRLVIRDALFRLWRSVIPSGDLADFIRDNQEDKVVPKVEGRISAATPLGELVMKTLDACLELTF